MSYIYKITNNINQKIYIGKTSSSIQERFNQHKRDSRKITKEKRPLYEAMNKYGIENFTIEEIEEVENDEIACEREKYWIQYFNSYIGAINSNGYNATLGGDGKRLYNYKQIANKYKELQNVELVANFFKCDLETVRKACDENHIHRLSQSEQGKKICSKKVAKIDKDTNEIICIYNSITEAFNDLNKTKSGGISKACRTNKVYIGYKWCYID